MNEVFVAMLDGVGASDVELDDGGQQQDVGHILAHFAGPQGGVLRIEGWWVVDSSPPLDKDSPLSHPETGHARGKSTPCFYMSTDVAVPRRASVVLLRNQTGEVLTLHSDSDNTTACLSGQIQVISVEQNSTHASSATSTGTTAAASGVFRTVERLTKACLLPLVKDAIDAPTLRQEEGKSRIDSTVDKSAMMLMKSSDPFEYELTPSTTSAAPVNDNDMRLAKEVLQRVVQLRGSLEALHKEAAISTFKLEVHPLIDKQVKEREGSGGTQRANGSGAEGVAAIPVENISTSKSVDELGLGCETLAAEGFLLLPPREKEKRYTHFLNELQWLVTSQWKKEVKRLVAVTREPFPATCGAEAIFWSSLHDALSEARRQFDALGPRCTLDVLRLSNRNIQM